MYGSTISMEFYGLCNVQALLKYIRIALKNEKDHVINKIIEQIIVIPKFWVFIPDLWKWISKLSNFSIPSIRANPYRRDTHDISSINALSNALVDYLVLPHKGEASDHQASGTIGSWPVGSHQPRTMALNSRVILIWHPKKIH